MDVAGELMSMARQEQADAITRERKAREESAAAKRAREEAQREAFEESWLFKKFPSRNWIIEERFDKITSMGSMTRFYLVHHAESNLYFMMYGADKRTFSWIPRVDFRTKQNIWVMGIEIKDDAGLAKYAHQVLLRGA